MAPLGDERLHELLATQCSLFASVHRKQGDPPVTPEEFLPWRQRARKTDRPRWEDDMKAHFQGLARRKGTRKKT